LHTKDWTSVSDLLQPWVAEPFSKWRGTIARRKTIENVYCFKLATVTSQALKCDVFTYTPYEGL